MKTLTEHNNSVKIPEKIYKMAGVKCDVCGTEMHYTDKYFMSMPPKYGVECKKCGSQGIMS